MSRLAQAVAAAAAGRGTGVLLEGSAGIGKSALLAAAQELLRLRPLTREGLAVMVEERLTATPDPAFVEASLHATGGTPFLVRELLGALEADSIRPDGQSAPTVRRAGSDAVRRWMLVRLGALPTAARRLATSVSVPTRAT